MRSDFMLVRGGLGVLLVRFLGIGLALASSVILARVLGVDQFGIYSFVISSVMLLVVPAQFGLTTLVVRETAQSETGENWAHMIGVWRWSTRTSLFVSLFIGIVGSAYVYLSESPRRTVLLAGFALIPIISLSSLRAAALQGLRRTVISQLPDGVIRPLLFITPMLLLWLINAQVRAVDAMRLQLVSTTIAFTVGVVMLNQLRPRETRDVVKPEFDRMAWRASVLPMALADGISVLNTQAGVIMLGIMAAPTEVGYYAIAATGGAVLVAGVDALATTTMPYLARFITEKDMAAFQRMAVLAARLGLAVAAPAMIVLVLWAKDLLRMIYGSAFLPAYWPLIILASANFCKTGFGLQGTLLNMSGHERDNLIGAVITALINLILNFALIPSYGAIGAATGTALAIFCRVFLYWALVRLRLGVDSSFLGFWKNGAKLETLSR